MDARKMQCTQITSSFSVSSVLLHFVNQMVFLYIAKEQASHASVDHGGTLRIQLPHHVPMHAYIYSLPCLMHTH